MWFSRIRVSQGDALWIEKKICDKIWNIYKGDDKVKNKKLQIHIRKFKSLKMKDEENVVAYLLYVDEIVDTIKGLCQKVEEPIIVQKVLWSLPLRLDSKFSTI